MDIENKKEELRQMVGRRYRDVLEASNAVKHLTEILDEIKKELKETRHISSAFNVGLGDKNCDQDLSTNSILTVQNFMMYNTFIAQVNFKHIFKM